MRIRKYKTMLTEDGLAALEIEKTNNYPEKKLDNAGKVVDMINKLYELYRQTEEYVYLVCFNTKQKVNGVFEVSHGSVSCSICQPREIFQKAILTNASSIIILHNHPSQDPVPSKEDIEVYDRLKEIGKIMGIAVLDSIVIGGPYSYYSMKEEGR